jgi:hypothetical protein
MQKELEMKLITIVLFAACDLTDRINLGALWSSARGAKA